MRTVLVLVMAVTMAGCFSPKKHVHQEKWPLTNMLDVVTEKVPVTR